MKELSKEKTNMAKKKKSDNKPIHDKKIASRPLLRLSHITDQVPEGNVVSPLPEP